MNTELITDPDVTTYVAAVRERLRDLPGEDQQDLTEGLEADMTEKVAEQGRGVLDDPEGYARELRVAAGFSPDPAPVRERGTIGESVSGMLDAAHTRWNRLVTGLPGDPWGFAQTLRPAWWVLRAWIALQLIDLIWGGGGYNFGLSVIPTLGPLGWPLLIVAIVISAQIGRGKLWPGREKSGAFERVVLLGLNTLAIALIPVTFTSVFTPAKASSWYGSSDPYGSGFRDGQNEAAAQEKAGIFANGRWISQIYPYDAAGKPMVGVQLFDQEGKPINLETQTECVYDDQEVPSDQTRVYYPWTNGAAQQKNVVPVPSVLAEPGVSDPDPQAFARTVKPTIGQFPFASVPSISLPGLAVSEATTPKSAYEPGDKPKAPINGVDEGC